MIIMSQLMLSIDEPTDSLREKIAQRLRLPIDGFSYTILKESLDARRRDTPRFSYQVAVDAPLSEKKVRGLKDKNITWHPSETIQPIEYGSDALPGRPIIVGAGPAGLFAAYVLAEHGYQPLLLEQGQPVPTRTEQVARFWQEGALDLQSNVQFGEGCAGTFSDGKLTSRSKNPLGHQVSDTQRTHCRCSASPQNRTRYPGRG